MKSKRPVSEFENALLGLFEEGCVYDCWRVGRKLYVSNRRKFNNPVVESIGDKKNEIN